MKNNYRKMTNEKLIRSHQITIFSRAQKELEYSEIVLNKQKRKASISTFWFRTNFSHPQSIRLLGEPYTQARL